MNATRYLLTLAATLLLPHYVHAQQSSGKVHVFRFPDADAPRRGPGWGFSTIMRPGPGNDPYVYPMIDSVASGSAADKAGMMVGDSVISIDGRDMRFHPFFPVQVAGTRYVILVRRGSEELELVFIYPGVQAAPPTETPAAAPPE